MVFSTVSRDAVTAYTEVCVAHQAKPNMSILSAIKGHTLDTIHVFDLSAGYFGSKQVDIIAQLLPECPFLNSLNVSGNSVTPKAIEALCAGLARGVVQRVDFSNNPMDIHSGQRILETLRHNVAITSCSVTNCMLPDYLVGDISVQVEMNDLLFRKREVEKKELSSLVLNAGGSLTTTALIDGSVRSAVQRGGGASPLNFDEVSNADDIESLAESSVMFDNDDVSDISNIETSTPQLLLNNIEAQSSAHLRGVAQKWIGATDSVKGMISLAMTSGNPFTDSSFPLDTPSSTSFWKRHLALDDASTSLQWMRFPEYCRHLGVAPNFSGKTLLVSSRLRGTRWLECALSVVRDSEALRNLACVRALPDVGLYHFQFFKADTRVEVVVDDWVPVIATTNGNGNKEQLFSLACLHNEDPSDAWAALLEKAYAKLHGGYEQLLGGSMRYALEDLTGAVCCKHTWTVSSVRLRGRENFFRSIRDHVIHRRIAAVKSSALGALQRSSLQASGILPNRSYLLHNAIPLSDGTTFVVQLSSPTNALTWQGKFGPTSLELKNAPELQQQQQHTPSSPFWISFEDFVSMFDSMYVLHHIPSIDISLRVLSVDGQTCGTSAPLGSAGWPMNDSVMISTTSKEADVIIRVLQVDSRLERSGDFGATPFGLEAHIAPHGAPAYDGWGSGECVSNCGGDNDALIRGRELIMCVKVRKDAPLRLVVSSDSAAAPYQVIASSTKAPFALHRQPSLYNATWYNGTWAGPLAAGRHHNAGGVKDSTQLVVTFPASVDDAVAIILLDQGVAHAPYSIGMVGKDGNGRVQSSSDLQPFLAVDFSARRTIGTTIKVPAGNARSFVIIPMTWNAGEEGNFVVTALCESRTATIVELKP